MAKGSKGKSAINVDFSNVGEGGGATRVAAGEYAVKVIKVESKMSSKDKPYLNWELQGINGALKGKKIWYTTSLQDHALFNLRNVLLACKVDVKKSKMSIDLKKLVGLVFGVEVDDEEYKGKTRSSIVDVFPVTVKKDGKMIKEALDDADEDEDDDEDLEDIDIDEDEDDDEDEDTNPYEDLSDKEIKALCKEKGIKTKGLDRDGMIEALEEADDDEDED